MSAGAFDLAILVPPLTWLRTDFGFDCVSVGLSLVGEFAHSIFLLVNRLRILWGLPPASSAEVLITLQANNSQVNFVFEE